VETENEGDRMVQNGSNTDQKRATGKEAEVERVEEKRY